MVQNVYSDIIINKTIFPSLERCSLRYNVVTSEWEDDGFGSYSNSGSSHDSDDSKRSEDLV